MCSVPLRSAMGRYRFWRSRVVTRSLDRRPSERHKSYTDNLRHSFMLLNCLNSGLDTRGCESNYLRLLRGQTDQATVARMMMRQINVGYKGTKGYFSFSILLSIIRLPSHTCLKKINCKEGEKKSNVLI